MGKKNKPERKGASKQSQSSESREIDQEELLKSIGDCTIKKNWDNFFKDRGFEDPFERYAEWLQLQSFLTGSLLEKSQAQLRILVPGCGNSRVSEHLYDAGFLDITNVDFSTVVIAEMLKRNVRERPEMKWRVMDITKMKIFDEDFDAIVDKGGLDALIRSNHDSRLGKLYTFEVKRLLKTGGKHICVTLAESDVLDLLFPAFRFGWKTSVHAIAQEPSPGKPKLQIFVLVAEKDQPTTTSIRDFINPRRERWLMY